MDETVRKRNPSKEEIIICPNCASTNLKSELIMSPQELSIHKTKLMKEGIRAAIRNPLSCYLCLNCDYFGTCPKIEKNHLDEFKKDIKSNEKRII